jgi:hypothetical protein
MNWNRQPAAIIGIIVSSVLAVVSVLSTNGVLSEAATGQITDATNALGQLLVIVAPLITAILIRSQVTPVAAPKLPGGTIVEVTGVNDGLPNARRAI